eukprot:TRINITY_DN169_c0_g1_i3.p1 TRINITY_DN169_c0_g1~~TRINITY_DN169_c0_g1_i3.p1  ORF type:complete len:65 (-),score=4.40 TRINITY_DN169_c0_g1_i3:189-383(-)
MQGGLFEDWRSAINATRKLVLEWDPRLLKRRPLGGVRHNSASIEKRADGQTLLAKKVLANAVKP